MANYGKFLRYELFATGSGHRGQGFWSAEYNLRDARYALPVMRRRIWAHAGVIQPERHCCHRSISINGGGSVRGSVQQQQQQQQPPCEGVRDLVRVIVVQNKRYSPAEVDVIQSAIVALELEDKRAVAAKNGTLSRIDIKYINWKGLPRMRDRKSSLNDELCMTVTTPPIHNIARTPTHGGVSASTVRRTPPPCLVFFTPSSPLF